MTDAQRILAAYTRLREARVLLAEACGLMPEDDRFCTAAYRAREAGSVLYNACLFMEPHLPPDEPDDSEQEPPF